ncbi:putative PurR-regulated permease PerM [Microbacterium terrae]|uniref:AI-2 transport protein TqsA n=1 Tax=Microbacterium terrae TaxID=69369 RepID=A0A0M2H2N1_9MICO|nr:AI-2E family transporter [Microbacterium terrae]KJL40523.1 AI-2 transport protein TqsA [Microbacterium terrae]MBP1079152.1 putative PurR-regulated permease PerM [Microbacterium terrae]GLJ98553.1 AI-2E family transporter [Microbacterium terrae]
MSPASDPGESEAQIAAESDGADQTAPAASFDVEAEEPPRSRILAALDRPLVSAFAATLGVLGAVVIGSAIGSISSILVWIILGLFLAIALDPIVRLLERKGLRRGAGIAVVFGAFVLLVVVFLVFMLPPVVNQVGEFVAAIPDALADVGETEWFAGLSPDLQAAVAAAVDQIESAVRDPATLAAVGGGILVFGAGVAAAISASLVVVALTLYFLASFEAMKEAFYRLAPARTRPRLADMTERITTAVGSSLIGSITLSALNAGTVLVLHLLIGLPFAALMAVIAFVVTLIPLFGSVIFLVFGTAVALFSGPDKALLFLIAYLVYIQVESYIISPRVMNRAIAIPAALVLIGAMIGGALMGVLGVLVALPVTASILLILREIVVPKQDRKI